MVGLKSRESMRFLLSWMSGSGLCWSCVRRGLATLLRVSTSPRPGPRDRGANARWGFARVVGDSMRPGLRAGDRLLVGYRRTPRPGDIVVARFADGTLAVKRAVERRGPGWWLLSDNPDEDVDSRHRG